MGNRITRDDLNWGPFYITHPDINFFDTLIGVDCEYLEDYYKEYKGRSDAKSVTGEGLYAYLWELIPTHYIIDNYYINSDGTHYLIYLPDDMLPIVDKIAFFYKGSEYPVTSDSNINIVDDFRIGKRVFSLKIPKTYFVISGNSIIRGGETSSGIWVPEFYKDNNYIEDHFGKILGIDIDRAKYNNINIKSFDQYSLVLPPSERVKLIHKLYSEMMKDLIMLMLASHPSPKNMLSLVNNILKKYGVDYNTFGVVKDRIIEGWDKIERRSMFIVEHNSFDDKAESVLMRMIAYFKPVFAWAAVKRDGFHDADTEKDITFDDISMYSNLDMDHEEYDTVTIMQASLSENVKLSESGTLGSFDDNIEIIYMSQYKE